MIQATRRESHGLRMLHQLSNPKSQEQLLNTSAPFLTPHQSMGIQNRPKGSTSGQHQKSSTRSRHLQPQVNPANMVLDSSMDCPRDLKQVQNMKYAVNCQSRKKDGGMQHQQNSADYIQTVISQLDNHPFVQHLVPLKGKENLT